MRNSKGQILFKGEIIAKMKKKYGGNLKIFSRITYPEKKVSFLT
jgi:hypothetical protein